MKTSLSQLPARFASVASFTAVGLAFALSASCADAPAQLTPSPPSPKNSAALTWDAEVKEHQVSPGEAKANFKFWFTNASNSEVIIQSANSICQCTVAKLPQQPWPIPPRGHGSLDVSMDLVGKSGQIEKPIYVRTSAGEQILRARVLIPAPSPVGFSTRGSDAERMNNLRQAAADRQAVFKNQDCAKCHAQPAKGKSDGRELYAAVCAICHDSAHRAPMVPDLRTLPHPTNETHWRNWISQSRPGSLMPAFAESEGGPLTSAQLDALARYLAESIPTRTVVTARAGEQ